MSVSRSHPVWVRGLKQNSSILWPLRGVAPRVGAWIETSVPNWDKASEAVAPRVGAWIETFTHDAKYLDC